MLSFPLYPAGVISVNAIIIDLMPGGCSPGLPASWSAALPPLPPPFPPHRTSPVNAVCSLFSWSMPSAVYPPFVGVPPASLKSLSRPRPRSTVRRPSPISRSAVRGPPSEFVYSFPLFVDGLPPASLKSLSRPRPQSTAHRPSSILPSAVRGPRSPFVYSFPHSLTVCLLPASKAFPAIVHSLLSTVHRPFRRLPSAAAV
jgi:hypothetical protein